ncbi:MAG: hypothetical protein ACOCP8_08310 [archaeon]
MLTTVVNYPERGPWGNNKYRGNFSGFLVKDLIEFFEPNTVYDGTHGGGTTSDVCKDLGVSYFGTDLNPKYGGVDLVNDEIPYSADMTIVHWPYHNIIKYSGNMWGTLDDRDLSRCNSYSEFIKKLNKAHAKLLSSLRNNGRLVIVVGDVKRKGKLYSIQRDMAWFGQPEQIIIKGQHNCWSDNKTYAKQSFIPIKHEYVLIFKRNDCYIIPGRFTFTKNYDLRKSNNVTWRDLVLATIQKINKKTVSLQELYEEIKDHEKCKNNVNWQAKVRQTVYNYNNFNVPARGKVSLAAA